MAVLCMGVGGKMILELGGAACGTCSLGLRGPWGLRLTRL